jgi:translocation and assembly module TamB
MSDTEPISAESPPLREPRRMLWNMAGVAIAAGAILAVLCFWASSQQFEDMVRRRLVTKLETATGGRVEIGSLHWRLRSLEVDAAGVVIHGLEKGGDEPYVQVENLHFELSVLGLVSPKIRLNEMQVVRPQFHLIFYPDGSTNQPQPRKQQEAGKPMLGTLFDLKAGHIALKRGVIDLDNRAAALDFQDRLQPLDFDANDVSVVMTYVPAANRLEENYHIEAGATDLNLARGENSRLQPPAVHGFMRATIDLTRNAAYLRSLRVTSHARGKKDRTLEISGALTDFAHPKWQAKIGGDLDMGLLNPVLGYPFAPEGIARLDLDGAGHAGEFRADGTIHLDDGAYVAQGVIARGVTLDARVHADPVRLFIGSVIVRLRQGGQLEGSVDLDHWLPLIPGGAVMEAAQPNGKRGRVATVHAPPRARAPVSASADVTTIPVNGKVLAEFKNVPLDAVLDIVGQPPFQRLGIDGRLTGTAKAIWVHGDVKTLSVDSALGISPSDRTGPGGVPANGAIEGTYTQRDGVVDVRRFEVNLPASQVTAHGHLGAFPLTSPTAIELGFRSRNLGEFDTVLRSLGLARNGKSGTEALPIALGGQAEFHGTWAGSLVSPRLGGSLHATQLSVELPAASDGGSKSQVVRWDSVDVDGSYDAERIAVVHGLLRHGAAEIALDGTLAAAKAPGTVAGVHPNGNGTGGHGADLPAFDSDALLRVRVRASKVGVGDLLPLTGLDLPISGSLNAQFDTDGPLHELGGTGWAELNDGVVYGEAVSHLRAQGSLASRVLKLTSFTATEKAGTVSGSGSYDLRSRRFQADAHGGGIDVAKLDRLRSMGESVTGKLEFSMAASGTANDPTVEGHATVANLAVGGQALGALQLTAHTVNRALVYDFTTRLESAQVAVHGQSELRGDYITKAKLDFSHFDVGVIFKLAHIEGIAADSALAGTATVQGPLARPEQMRGEVRLEQVAVRVAEVHLQSSGGLHATLSNNRVTLDPLHITGEETDLRAQGSLELKDTRRLDFAANGSVNLKLAQTLDRDLTASGTTTFQVEAHGPLANPDLKGRIDFRDGALSLEDLPNGLSQLHGSLEFNQNRLEVKSLTAMTGGGLLSVGGYLAYQRGVYADLSVTGKGIRIRYPQGVSSLADASLRLQGSQNNLLLSGGILITRFSVSSDLDIAALAAQATAVQPIAAPDAPSNHIRLDVHVQSSPQLNFQNAYAKLAGDVDLRLRGTVATPSLLGRVSITEGNAIVAGTRYELQRGEVTFSNPVRIQPVLDLNATARVEDYDITLGLHGSPDKMAVTYRSDPPLPEADVVALLALGRTQSEQGIYTQQQQQSAGLSPSTDVLLGGALNATVSSRVQKLFGAGSVKVDPSYLGALGNSTTRITVEEQLGKNITLTYATNVDTSAQQLLQAEIAVNRHVSVLVERDESGVFSMVLKATRRYK